MIEVFKTDVAEISQARELTGLLLHHFPGSRINFDLQDCDKILRMEGAYFNAGNVVKLLSERGFNCAVLE